MSYPLASAVQCNICLRELLPLQNPLNLHKCSGCHMIMYCGSEHQLLHRAEHKDFCKAAAYVKAKYKVQNPFKLALQIDMKWVKMKLKFELRQKLQRALTFLEEELTSFPRCCAVCQRFKICTFCAQCQVIGYCSLKHQQQHAAQHAPKCYLLQLNYCVFKLHSQDAAPQLQLQGNSTDLLKSNLCQVFEKLTKLPVPTNATKCLQDYALFASCADFSCVATLCYALSWPGMSTLTQSNCLELLVIGATVESALWFTPLHLQLFFVQFAHLQMLRIYFVGPEVPAEMATEHTIQMHQRQHCVVVQQHATLVQHFCHTCHCQPTLAIAYNCGFAEQPFDDINTNSWTVGITALLQQHKIPLIFTSFTRSEAEMDHEVVTQATAEMAMQTILSAQVNPYHDLRPLRHCQLHNDEEEFYYRNAYIQAVKAI